MKDRTLPIKIVRNTIFKMLKVIVVIFVIYISVDLSVMWAVKNSEAIGLKSSLYDAKNIEDIARLLGGYVISIVNVCVAGWIMSAMLRPVSKVEIDKHFVYQKDIGFVFRYWLSIPRGAFWYNVKLKVVIYKDDIVEGVNKRKYLWSSDCAVDKTPYMLDRIRGDRYLVINGKDKKRIKKVILENCTDTQNLIVELAIVGNDENGKIVSKCMQYKVKEDLLVSYFFAPTNVNGFSFKKYIGSVKERNDKLFTAISEDSFRFYHMENWGYYFCTTDYSNKLRSVCKDVPVLKDKSKLLSDEEVVLGHKYKSRVLLNVVTACLLRESGLKKIGDITKYKRSQRGVKQRCNSN